MKVIICALVCIQIFLEQKNVYPLNDEISSATHYLLENYKISDNEQIFALSIAAPELIRYSYFQNFLETKSLEWLYVQYGTDGADFSIGPFQMKPSFIEELERQVSSNVALSNHRLIAKYATSQKDEVRKMRIDRIQQPKFQLLYLSAFRAYCKHRYSSYLQWASTEEKLRFMATAYNLGFSRSTQNILDYMPQRNFPYGANYSGTQYAYGQLAVDIYQTLMKKDHANSKAQ